MRRGIFSLTIGVVFIGASLSACSGGGGSTYTILEISKKIEAAFECKDIESLPRTGFVDDSDPSESMGCTTRGGGEFIAFVYKDSTQATASFDKLCSSPEIMKEPRLLYEDYIWGANWVANSDGGLSPATDVAKELGGDLLSTEDFCKQRVSKS